MVKWSDIALPRIVVLANEIAQKSISIAFLPRYNQRWLSYFGKAQREFLRERKKNAFEGFF